MMKYKKAQIGTLVMLIIVLASAAVLGAFIYKASVKAKGKSELELCRMSIVQAAQEKRMGFPGIKKAGETFGSLSCRRGRLGDIVIKKDDIVDNDKINQDKAHRIIAEGMRECWYMAGEGLLDPFSYWSSDTYEQQSLCLICKTIYFDDDLVEWMGKKQQKLIKEEFGIDVNKFSNDEEGIKAFEQESIRLKNTLSEQEKKEFEEKNLDYVITSPLPYLQTKNLPNIQKTYWEYLYNEKAAKLSPADEENLRKTQVLPNSVILVRLYRTKTKDAWYWTVTKWVGGAIVVIGAILLIIGTFGGFALVLTILKGAVAVMAVVVKSFILSAIVLGITAAMIVPVGLDSYKHCPDCEGIGGVVLIQPDITPLESETKVCLDEKGCPPGDLTEVQICNLLVN